MKRILSTLVLLTALSLSACGAGKPSTTLDVVMSDFAFTPNAYVVPAGKEITLNIRNNGAVVHNFIIMKLDTSAGADWDDTDQVNVFWEERDITPGGEISVTFTAPTEPGEYQVVCRTAGHIASGMIGKLTVVAGDE
jgi:plastocyanin